MLFLQLYVLLVFFLKQNLLDISYSWFSNNQIVVGQF